MIYLLAIVQILGHTLLLEWFKLITILIEMIKSHNQNTTKVNKMTVLYTGSLSGIKESSLVVSVLLILSVLTFLSANANQTQNVNRDILLHGMNRDVYSKPGDINIGSLMVLSRGIENMACTKNIYPGSWVIEYTEAVAFAVDVVNKNSSLLPNITLGFYILDDCSDRSVALSQALTFLPRIETTCSQDSCNNSSTQSPPLSSRYKPEETVPYYPVIGVLAPMMSVSAVPVSYLFNSAKMPSIGHTTTTDELSNKNLHPYFLRVVTPDIHQAIAMLKFIAENGWSYISVVYSQGQYGEKAFDTIKHSASRFNICIATSHRVGSSDDTLPVAKDLLSYQRARVVILFAEVTPVSNLLTSVDQLNATGQFIWIGSDSVTTADSSFFVKHRDHAVGMYLFIYYATTVSEFYQYLRTQHVHNSKNPWFKSSWESTAGCSFEDGTCDPNQNIVDMPNFGFQTTPSLAMDAVLAFAHGAHDLITDLCPGSTGLDAAECIERDTLLAYLKNVSFEGYTGRINFDEFGDVNGKYTIQQLVYTNDGTNTLPASSAVERKVVALYDTATDYLSYTDNRLSWDHLLEKERVVPLLMGQTPPEIPESVCSRPCVLGEYKIQKELTCCWECRKCRDNERLINDNTGCEECEIFTWPDTETQLTTCSPIPLTHQTISDTLSVILVCIATGAIGGTALVIICYIHHRETRVLKAASRELSGLQLGAIVVGYVTVICFQTKPTENMCSTLYFMFCLSFSWLYAPLLVKAIRIFRIFRSGSKHNQRPKFISPGSQIMMALILIFVQVVLCLIMYVIYTPTAKTTQPILTVKSVELFCDMTLPGLASFLTYNLVLVSLCSVFAFKTRKLPDNFNESRFISMCVSTTLVIWLAFIPTYYTATKNSVRALLLSASLILNHTVALVFLFIPKIYAAVYLPDERLLTTRMQTEGTVPTGPLNRVAPLPAISTLRPGF